MKVLASYCGLCLALWTCSLVGQEPQATAKLALTFTIERSVAHSGFDQQTCWVHARAGIVPAGMSGNDSTQPCVVMTLQKLQLSGSDLFEPLSEMRSLDGGLNWSSPQTDASFARQTFHGSPDQLPTGADIAPELLSVGDQTLVCDFTPQWHVASQRLLGIGHTVWYRDQRVATVRPRGIAYSVYRSPTQGWAPWQTVQLPKEPKFQNAGAGSAQRVDVPGGDVLLPIYFKEPQNQQYSVTVCRCRFDGRTLEYVSHGDELSLPLERGLFEPSLTRFEGRYYLTLRNDLHGYVSSSDDGNHFSPPQVWRFDDDSVLGNYNTQQHWVTHANGLFLVYTRRGANNDHVFRHRAPLFIARVDPSNMHIIRDSEQVLVPERGARLGNFGVVDVSPDETWITAAEWMQPVGVEEHGSDNSLFVAKLTWNRPNTQPHTLENSTAETSTAETSTAETSTAETSTAETSTAETSTAETSTAETSTAETSTAWKTIEPYFTPPLVRREQLGNYHSPLVFNDGSQVQTPRDWSRRRTEIFTEWQQLLGTWPPLITDPQVTILQTQRRANITQHRIRFRWTPDEETTGYLLIPDGPGKHPAVISVYYEPETAIGQGSAYRDFAWQLAQRGFVTLSIGTTQASEAKTYALFYPNIVDAQVQPLSMLACAAANAWHVLAARPEVDAERIGIVGHSFGGKWAMFAACLFDKFACGAWSDPGIVFDAERASVNYWEPWYLGYHSPPWRPRGLITPDNPARGLYPQLVAAGDDLHELHALMAPRPFLVSGGAEDPPQRWEALNHSVAINRLLGLEHRVAMTNRPEHSPNADSNSVMYAFFQHFLGAK